MTHTTFDKSKSTIIQMVHGVSRKSLLTFAFILAVSFALDTETTEVYFQAQLTYN